MSSLGSWLRQSRRYAHRYNLIQPVDTNHINALLSSATALEHAAVPVLRYAAWFDPEQVTATMQRVPRMLQYQRRKGRRGAAYASSTAASTDVARALMDALGSRLAVVAPACSDQQLARALWALGASRHPHPQALAAACEVLPARLKAGGGGMVMGDLATAAWGLAAAASAGPASVREPVRRTLQEIARHLVASRPADLSASPALPPPTSSSASASSSPPAGGAGVAPAADEVAAAASAAALAADRPWLDPRSAVKLAWAFANCEVGDAAALDVVAEAAAARIASQLQAHDPNSGPLTPRATYLYKTIRGWQAWPRPRPRVIRSAASASRGGRSRYLYDDRPRVVLRDFTAGSLAQLLAALAAAGHRHEGLMQAAAAHLTASSGRSLRVDPHDLKRLAAAFAKLDLAAAGSGGGSAGSATAAALTVLLSAAQLSSLPAPLLARLTILAAESGVRRRSVYDRLVRQLMARAWVPGPDGQPPAAAGAAAAGGSTTTAAPLVVVDEAETAAAAGAADPDDLGGPVVLEPRARESHYARARGSSYDSAALARRVEAEAAGWAGVLMAPRDVCSPALLARVLRSLAKVGYTASDPLSLPFAARLFDLISPHVAAVAAAPPPTAAGAAAPRDSLTDLAAAALSYRDQLDKTSATVAARGTRDTIRDITNVVLYGSPERAKAADGDLVRRLLELTQRSLGGGAAAAAGGAGDAGLAAAQHDAAAAAELRQRMGLSARGAMRLALTLSRWPEAVEERELKAVLSLVEVPPPVAEAEAAGPAAVAAAERERRRLGELLGNLSNAGRRGAVPPRLLAALGDTGPVVGL